MQHIYIKNEKESTAQTDITICFDTGLDPRSFARTKMSQSLIEPGYIVSADGTHKVWKAAGVDEIDGYMRVWGPMFSGERLDLLLNEIDSETDSSQAKQRALQAAAAWIKAKLFLGETKSAINPGASFISKDNVFFAPEHLSDRCLHIEHPEIDDMHQDRYNCPDLDGIRATAFCAGVMLYKILTGTHPYPTSDIFQNMREGVFLPVFFAAPEMNENLSGLIQAALLLPAAKKQTSKSAGDILAEILKILCEKTETVLISSLFTELPAEKKTQIEKDKKLFLFKQKSIVRIKRFAANHKQAIIISGAALLFFLFIFINFTRPDPDQITTEGMTSNEVIRTYYNAFGKLDHFIMDACVQGADKSDINAAATLFAINKMRQSYENSNSPLIIPAEMWLLNGGELPAPNVFGVTDLNIEVMDGREVSSKIIYRADYLFWAPDEYSIKRSDLLTLKRDKKKNWRITEILRKEL